MQMLYIRCGVHCFLFLELKMIFFFVVTLRSRVSSFFFSFKFKVNFSLNCFDKRVLVHCSDVCIVGFLVQFISLQCLHDLVLHLFFFAVISSNILDDVC